MEDIILRRIPLKVPDMKKFLSILLVLIALTAAACGKGDDPATAQDAQSAADSASGLLSSRHLGPASNQAGPPVAIDSLP